LILKKQGRQSRNAFIWLWTKYCLLVKQNIAVINKTRRNSNTREHLRQLGFLIWQRYETFDAVWHSDNWLSKNRQLGKSPLKLSLNLRISYSLYLRQKTSIFWTKWTASTPKWKAWKHRTPTSKSLSLSDILASKWTRK